MNKIVGAAASGLLLLTRVGWGAVSPPTPLEVKVEVTEVDNSKASSVGVDWPGSIAVQETPHSLVQLGSFQRATGLQADVKWLIETGAAELLANPNLVTDSGTTATFHAGGQIPYVTHSSLGTTNVEFKPYGVLLKVQPSLLKSGEIRLKVQASVSAPDPTNGVVLSGITVPALLEREVTSSITLKEGATVALAGLVQSQKEELIRGVPFLRRIPLLGAFFRWKRTSFRRSTIIIFVTPEVIQL